MARLNPNIPSPSKQPGSSKPSSLKHPATTSASTTQTSSFDKFLSKTKIFDPESRAAPNSSPTSAQGSPDFSSFSINKSIQPPHPHPAEQMISMNALRDSASKNKALERTAEIREGKRSVGYSTWDIPAPEINAPIQESTAVSPPSRHARIRSCESVDVNLGGRTDHDVAAVEKSSISRATPATGALNSSDVARTPVTSSSALASSFQIDETARATHLSKVHQSLGIHGLLLTRLNALPLSEAFGLHECSHRNDILTTQDSKTLHNHLGRCEQNLHWLLREEGSNVTSIALRVACVEILELVAGRLLEAWDGEGGCEREWKEARY
ncbi:MAG: hypothetical protein Q9195_009005 [Heterodermia aff. obscurata]